MNVLYLTANRNRASTTIPTEGWFRLLRPRGLKPVLASHATGAFHAWAVEEGIPAYHVPMPMPEKLAPWRFLRSLWRLASIARRHQVQIIHCNEQDVYHVGHYLARLCRLPIVVGVHCSMDREGCEWLFAGARQPDRVFFISRGSQELCRPSFAGIVPEKFWRLLPNGLDLERYRPDPALRETFRQEHGLTAALTVGVACALRPGKQLEHLIEACSRLTTRNVRVLLAGGPVPGEEDYAKGILQMARERLGDRLLYLGHLSDLRSFYNALDVCVNTSAEEACSITILEALASGCPVVGYPSKSVDEQVLPGGGAIVCQDDVAELTATLDEWLRDPQALAMARRNARRRVEDAYDIRDRAAQLWDEYHAILAEAGGDQLPQPRTAQAACEQAKSPC